MSNDLLNRQDQDSDQDVGSAPDPIQADIDQRFNEMTSAENYAQDGVRSSLRGAEDPTDSGAEGKSLFNSKGDGGDDESGGKGSGAAGVGALGAAEAAGSGLFNPLDAAGGGAVGAGRKLLSTFTGSRRRKQATIGGGIAGVLVTGTFFGLTILSGPAKLIQYSHLLQNVFNKQTSQNDTRMSRLVRGLRSGQVGETRIGYISSKYLLPKTQESLAKKGIKLQNDKFGRLTLVQMDAKLDPKYSNLSNEEAKIAIAKDNGLDVKKIYGNKGGYYRFNLRELSIKQQRGILKSYVQQERLGKFSQAVHFRTLTRYYGVPSALHPWQRAQAELDKKLSDRAQRPSAIKEYFKTKTAKLSATSAKARIAAKNINDKLGAKGQIIGGVLIAGYAICVAQDVRDDVPVLNKSGVVDPAKANATDAMAMGDQTEIDGTAVALMGIESQNMDGDGPNDSVYNSAGVMALSGQTGGVPVDPNVAQAFSPDGGTAKLDAFLKDVNADTICSTAGQVFSGIAGLALLALGPGGWAIKGIQTAASAVGTYAVVTAIQQIVPKMLAADPITGVSHHGAAGGNVDALGAVALAATQSMANGGVANGPAQLSAIKNDSAVDEQYAMAAKPWFERAFDINDHGTIGGQMIAGVKTNPSIQIAALTHGFMNIGGIFTRSAAALLPNASAATTTPFDFGYGDYTMGEASLTSEQVDLISDPQKNADIVAAMLDDPTQRDDIVNKVDTCFGDTINKDSQDRWQVVGAHDVNPYDKDYTSANCNDTSDSWIQVRFFVYDSTLMDGYACFAGDDESCTNSGFGSANTSATGIDPTAGGIGTAGGMTFPLKTTKATIKNNKPAWNTTALDNQHLNYNAADIFAPTGTPVVAAYNGTVVSTKYSPPNGTNLTYKTDTGLLVYYTHMGQGTVTVAKDDKITAGQIVGAVGTRADARGTDQHLHMDQLPLDLYKSRPICSNAGGSTGCEKYPFINIQPLLVQAFNALP